MSFNTGLPNQVDNDSYGQWQAQEFKDKAQQAAAEAQDTVQQDLANSQSNALAQQASAFQNAHDQLAPVYQPQDQSLLPKLNEDPAQLTASTGQAIAASPTVPDPSVPVTPSTVAHGTISAVNQFLQSNYDTSAGFQTWNQAACSAASMAAVMTALGKPMNISQALQALGPNNVTPSTGLLDASMGGLAGAMQQQGVQAVQQKLTLDQLTRYAASGSPVIVDGANSSAVKGWGTEGHIFTVTGLDGNGNFTVADSAGVRTSLSPKEMGAVWNGAAVTVAGFAATPAGQYHPFNPTGNANLDWTLQKAIDVGLDPNFIKSIAGNESGGNINAVSPVGAKGILQVMPATEQAMKDKYGINEDADWKNKASAGLYYMLDQLKHFGDPRLAAAAYNAGPGAVTSGAWKTYGETTAYVNKLKDYVGDGLFHGAQALQDAGKPVLSSATSTWQQGMDVLGQMNDALNVSSDQRDAALASGQRGWVGTTWYPEGQLTDRTAGWQQLASVVNKVNLVDGLGAMAQAAPQGQDPLSQVGTFLTGSGISDASAALVAKAAALSTGVGADLNNFRAGLGDGSNVFEATARSIHDNMATPMSVRPSFLVPGATSYSQPEAESGQRDKVFVDSPYAGAIHAVMDLGFTLPLYAGDVGNVVLGAQAIGGSPEGVISVGVMHAMAHYAGQMFGNVISNIGDKLPDVDWQNVASLLNSDPGRFVARGGVGALIGSQVDPNDPWSGAIKGAALSSVGTIAMQAALREASPFLSQLMASGDGNLVRDGIRAVSQFARDDSGELRIGNMAQRATDLSLKDQQIQRYEQIMKDGPTQDFSDEDVYKFMKFFGPNGSVDNVNQWLGTEVDQLPYHEAALAQTQALDGLRSAYADGTAPPELTAASYINTLLSIRRQAINLTGGKGRPFDRPDLAQLASMNNGMVRPEDYAGALLSNDQRFIDLRNMLANPFSVGTNEDARGIIDKAFEAFTPFAPVSDKNYLFTAWKEGQIPELHTALTDAAQALGANPTQAQGVAVGQDLRNQIAGQKSPMDLAGIGQPKSSMVLALNGFPFIDLPDGRKMALRNLAENTMPSGGIKHALPKGVVDQLEQWMNGLPIPIPPELQGSPAEAWYRHFVLWDAAGGMQNYGQVDHKPLTQAMLDALSEGRTQAATNIQERMDAGIIAGLSDQQSVNLSAPDPTLTRGLVQAAAAVYGGKDISDNPDDPWSEAKGLGLVALSLGSGKAPVVKAAAERLVQQMGDRGEAEAAYGGPALAQKMRELTPARVEEARARAIGWLQAQIPDPARKQMVADTWDEMMKLLPDAKTVMTAFSPEAVQRLIAAGDAALQSKLGSAPDLPSLAKWTRNIVGTTARQMDDTKALDFVGREASADVHALGSTQAPGYGVSDLGQRAQEITSKDPSGFVDRNDTWNTTTPYAEGTIRKSGSGVTERLERIPLTSIDNTPGQERIAQEAIDRYKENPGGVAPDVNRLDNGRYEITDGNHRVAAAQQSGAKDILAWVADTDQNGYKLTLKQYQDIASQQTMARDPQAIRRIYAYVGEGEPQPSKGNPGLYINWDPETTNRVTTLHHHFGLDPQNAGFEMHTGQGASPGLQAAMWNPAMRDFPEEGLQDVAGRPIASTPWLVGPDGENAMRAAGRLLSIGQQDIKAINQGKFAGGRDLASYLLQGKSDQFQVMTNSAQQLAEENLGRRLSPEEITPFRTAVNAERNRTESLILEPSLQNAKHIVVVGNSGEAFDTKLQAAQDLAAKILEEHGISVPVVAHRLDAAVEDGLITPGPKMMGGDVSPGRAAISSLAQSYGRADLGQTTTGYASALGSAATGVAATQQDPSDPNADLKRAALAAGSVFLGGQAFGRSQIARDALSSVLSGSSKGNAIADAILGNRYNIGITGDAINSGVVGDAKSAVMGLAPTLIERIQKIGAQDVVASIGRGGWKDELGNLAEENSLTLKFRAKDHQAVLEAMHDQGNEWNQQGVLVQRMVGNSNPAGEPVATIDLGRSWKPAEMTELADALKENFGGWSFQQEKGPEGSSRLVVSSVGAWGGPDENTFRTQVGHLAQSLGDEGENVSVGWQKAVNDALDTSQPRTGGQYDESNNRSGAASGQIGNTNGTAAGATNGTGAAQDAGSAAATGTGTVPGNVRGQPQGPEETLGGQANAAQGPRPEGPRSMPENINLDNYEMFRQNPELKNLADEMQQNLGRAWWDDQRGGVQPWQETDKMAVEMGADPSAVQELLTRGPGSAYTAPEITMLRRMWNGQMGTVVNAAQAVTDNPTDPLAMMQFLKTANDADTISRTLRGATAEAGRALGVFGMDINIGDAIASGDLDSVMNAIRKANPDMPADGLAQVAIRINKMDSSTPGGRAAIYRMFQPTDDPGWWHKLDAYRMFNMLSSWRTLMNIGVSGAGNLVWQATKRGLTDPVGAAQEFQGMGQSSGAAMRAAWDTLRSGVSANQWSRFATSGRSFYSPVGGDPQSLVNRVLGAPGLTHSALTDFFQTLSSGGTMLRMAHDLSATTGRSVDDLIANPTPEMTAAAQDQAQKVTFRENSALGSWIVRGQHLPGATGPLIDWVVPFAKIPVNKYTQSLQFLANPVSQPIKFFQAISKGDDDAARVAASKFALSLGAYGLFFSEAMQGNLTGNGPEDSNRRNSLLNSGDWQPNSMRIGGRWFKTTHLGPAGLLMSAIGNAVEQYKEAQSDPALQKTTPQIIAQSLQGVLSGLEDESMLQGIAEIADAIHDPTSWGRFAASEISELVPASAGMRGVENYSDSVQRQTGNFMRDPLGSIMSNVQAGIPGLAGQLRPRLTPLGNTVPRETGIGPALSPLQTQSLPSNAQEREVYRDYSDVRAAPTKVTNQITGMQTLLTDPQRYDITQIRGPGLRGAISALMQDPVYMNSQPVDRKRILDTVVSRYTTPAEVQALGPEALGQFQRPGMFAGVQAYSEQERQMENARQEYMMWQSNKAFVPRPPADVVTLALRARPTGAYQSWARLNQRIVGPPAAMRGIAAGQAAFESPPV